MNKREALEQVAKDIGCPDPLWLDQLISLESHWDPQVKNPYSSARGLIQFMDSTARTMGFSGGSYELVTKYPDVVSQLLGPVKDYFNLPGNKGPYQDQQDLFMTIFYPAYRKVLPTTMLPENVRKVNPGVNTVNDYINHALKRVGDRGSTVRNIPINIDAITGSWMTAPVVYNPSKISNEKASDKALSPYLIEESILNIPRDSLSDSSMDEEFYESALQIGDLVFLVDPTQISFNTQNGYQYFPTIRTKGNPKIPTEEYVKNFSINLIFPNEDSINYQLLHLYAMFRRTPFVNLRNKDITDFFETISYGSSDINPANREGEYKYKWLAVALESIQIQSVEGFPNTLQASITLLPMDYRTLKGGMKALLDYTDVALQQRILYRDWQTIESQYKSKQKLGMEEADFVDRVIDTQSAEIQSDADFRKSIPFRIFYQSLISNRNNIKNNKGENIESKLGTQAEEFAKCRAPIKTNLLNPYIATANQTSISFNYNYITQDLRSANKSLSELRMDRQTSNLSGLLNIYNNSKTDEDTLRSVLTVFANEKTFFELTKFKFDAIKNKIPEVLSRHGVTIPSANTQFSNNPVVALLQAIWGGLGEKVGTMGAAAAFKSLSDLLKGNGISDKTDRTGGTLGINFFQKGTNNVGSFQWGLNTIQDWMNDPKADETERKRRRQAFAATMVDINNIIQRELGIVTTKEVINIIDNPAENGGIPFTVNSLPIAPKTITIDNVKDVIVGWSLMFANKLIPINLQAWEYPYYQHIGCEDPAISLSIVSTSQQPIDLKSKLSTLSEDLHQSIRLVMSTAPEMIQYLDTRLRLDVPEGNIFNVFGIRDLVFESSNTTSITGKPNAWSTNINFTQADLTIVDYHEISSIPTNQGVLNDLSNLLVRIIKKSGVSGAEINKNGETISEFSGESLRNVEVIKFIDKTSKEEIKVDLSTLITIRFLQRYGSELSSLVEDAIANTNEYEDIKTSPENQQKIDNLKSENARNKRDLDYYNEKLKTETIKDVKTQIKKRIKSLKADILKNLALIDNLQNLAGGVGEYGQALNIFEKDKTKKKVFDSVLEVQQMLKNFNIEMVTDNEATEKLTNIINDFPAMESILKFLLTNLDSTFAQKIESYKQILIANKSFLSVFLNKLNQKTWSSGQFKSNLGILTIFTTGIIILTGGVFTGGLLFAGIGVGVATLLTKEILVSLGDEIQSQVKEKFIKEMGGFLTGIQDVILSSIVQDFANKLVRDPLIFKEFSKIFDKDTKERFEKLMNNKGVSCYKDFDLPDYSNLDEGAVIGPDFYLYNNIVEDKEIKEYITESMKRYAKIGKLSAMMCLEEAKDYITKFDTIIKNAGNLSPDILIAMTKGVLSGFGSEFENMETKDILEKISNTLELISLCSDSFDEAEIKNSEKLTIKLKDAYKKVYDPKSGTKPLSKKEYDFGLKLIDSYSKKMTNGIPVENMDYKKLNLVYAARTQTMIKIFEGYVSLNNLMVKKTDSNDGNLDQYNKEIKGVQEQNSNYDSLLTKGGVENLVMDKLYLFLNRFVPVMDTATSFNLDPALEDFLETMYTDGGFAKPTSGPNALMLPAVTRLENFMYNNIGYYLRLNTAIQEYLGKGGQDAIVKLDLSNIPELRYLDFWNFRAKEENERKIEILQNFTKNNTLKRDTTIKLYPTFKIFFIEEDKNLAYVNFDDYYTQDAINSIEIVSNKNSPSTTAIIRLSNVVGSLTDRASLLRESEDFNEYSINKPKNFYLGTLNLKPGTMILIKMGYGPYDKNLQVVFQGRIIEMNVGPVVQMVCQSFGAQLNHYIQAEKFGLFSAVREHGDVASTIIDMIPGLERLGKPSPFGLASMGDFTGKNIRNMRGKFGERLLMSNIMGNITSRMNTQDNPRDENIYLNYSVINSIWHHPTFDWVVYDQSVWEALQELSLYHRNTSVLVRPFNNNSDSTYNDLRETLVIGNKIGYYKYTDAYSLSSLNKREIDKAKQEFNTFKNSFPKTLNKGFGQENINGKDELFNTSEIAKYKLDTSSSTQYSYWNRGYKFYYLTQVGIFLYNFLQSPINSLLLVAYLLKKDINTKEGENWANLLASYLDSSKFKPSPFEILISDIITFSRLGTLDYSLLVKDFNETGYMDRIILFEKIIIGIINTGKDISLFEMEAEEFYNVKIILSNLEEKLSRDPQYKKIQTHHLVTDVSDIISNNITLNTTFNNMINVYYTGEPKISTSDINKLDDAFIENKLNVWTVKAFGEQRDEFCRPLNSYQKNIDTNWFDTTSKTVQFFENYRRIKKTDLNPPKEPTNQKDNALEKKLYNTTSGPNKTKIPQWDMFPSFVTVGASLLQKEVEKMYQGTIELVGNPNILPMDILHIQDYTNDMHGVVEVEEVIHTFTPDGGFRTVITPNLITYDREPVQLQDIQIINQIYDFAGAAAGIDAIGNGLVLAGVLAGSAGLSTIIPAPIAAGAALVGGAAAAYNGTVGVYRRYHKFLYEKLGNILGRDCINFTSLLYHGQPYMAGFDGVDYTSLKTLMNYNVAGIENPITRYFAFKNTFNANMLTGFDPDKLSITQGIFGRLAGTENKNHLKG
jgi:hypothetical protein